MPDVNLPLWVIDIIKQVGPFAVILLVLFWYVPRRAVSSFVEAQQNQAIAMAGIKDALAHMAEHGGRLEEKIDATMLNQRLVIGQLEKMDDKLDKHRDDFGVQIKTIQELLVLGRKIPEPGNPPADT